MPKLSIACFCLLPALGLTGCVSETQSAGKWDGSVRDSAGIQIVDNFGEPLWKPGEEWRLVEDIRIGMREGPPEYQFGQISGYGEMSDGRIVVADAMASKIRFYSPEGEHLYSVGKRGNGPREFGDGSLGLLQGYGDTLLVPDWRNLQTHRLAPDGTWLGSFSIRPEGEWRVSGWDTSPSGLISSSFAPLQQPDKPMVDTMEVVVIRHLDGTLGDTLGRVPIDQSFKFVEGEPQRWYYAGLPDHDQRWDDSGIVTGRSDTYELTWRLPGGQPEKIVRLHREPMPFTVAEQGTLMARFDDMLKSGDRTPERVEQIKNTIHFTDYYPYYRRLMNGPDGTLWLRHVRPIQDLSEDEVQALTASSRVRPGPGWDVFDRQGRYLGVVGAPPDLPAGGLRGGNRMVGIVVDEFDVQYLQIYRIEGLEQQLTAAD